MSGLTALAAAFTATVLAALRLVGFVATGELISRKPRAPYVAVPLAILVGAGATAVVYALLLPYAHLGLAIAVDAALVGVSLLLRGRHALRLLRTLFAELARALGSGRALWLLVGLVAAIYWVQAATPPRDTDSLRYHLAHIRQIDAEGVWRALPIIHYAFPFGWSLTYVPLVHVGRPEAAQLVNAGLALIVVAAILAWWREEMLRSEPARAPAVVGTTAVLALGAILLQPLVIATATNASADEYTILTVLATAMLLVTADGTDASDLRALGFAAWIGMQSRYQAAAIGLAATLIVVVWSARLAGRAGSPAGRPEGPRRRWRIVLWFAQGAALALLLAVPWYAANWTEFGNPIWPLHAHAVGGTYTDEIGSAFTRSWTGIRSLRVWAYSVWALVTDPLSFPLPLLVVVTAIAGIASRARRDTFTLGAFAAAYLLIWSLAQPMLYPRFIVYMLPAVLLVGLPFVARVRARRLVARRLVHAALAITIATFALYACASAAAPATFLVSGNAPRLHRYTWYYPVYTWIGSYTRADARFLVIVGSAESYHLDRFYRRADPATSAVIDWKGVRDADALLGILSREHYDYIVYERVDWSGAPGGAQMMRVVDDARARGLLTEVKTFQLEHTRSRFRNRAFTTSVLVLKVNLGPASR